MRGGKSILYLAIVFFVAWFVQPVWQWYLDRALDAATRPAGIAAMIALLAPVNSLLLGISIGMLIALLVGYWHQIIKFLLKLEHRFTRLLMILWQAMPGQHILLEDEVRFESGEGRITKSVPTRFFARNVTIRVAPYSNISAGAGWDGIIEFWRNDVTREQTATFQLLGRRYFWASLTNRAPRSGGFAF